jgi:hypothetical protein
MDREGASLSPGEKLPFCYGTGGGKFYSSDKQAGRAAVLILAAALDRAALDPLLTAFSALLPQFSAQQADLVLLVNDNPARLCPDGRGLPEGVRVVDCPAAFFDRCDAPAMHLRVLVIDRAARLVACPGQDDPAAVAASALAAVAAIGRAPECDCHLPAPVLLVPNVLDGALCRALIEHFDTGRTFDSGVTGIGLDDAQAEHRVDHRKKRRRDCALLPGEPLHDHVLGLLFRRCVPEIRKAFQHPVSHADRLLVARYDETGGYFRRHRDNAAESVAFRQFAVSVNLNTGQYEGGQLRFPEYNDHRYGPPVGGALVFSASLLHEATPVTRGCRYVLLTFLHDADAEARNQAFQKAARRRMLTLVP